MVYSKPFFFISLKLEVLECIWENGKKSVQKDALMANMRAMQEIFL